MKKFLNIILIILISIFTCIPSFAKKVETKSIKYVTNDELEENKILNIFKENQVTPINSEEVILDLFRSKF